MINNDLARRDLWDAGDRPSPLDCIRAAHKAVATGYFPTQPQRILCGYDACQRALSLLERHGETPEAVSQAMLIALSDGAYHSQLEDLPA